MINLKNRTEFSFRQAFGRIDDVITAQHAKVAGICDFGGTWGHVQWQNHCRQAGIKPIFGVTLACVNDMDLRDKQPTNYFSFLAKNNAGLRELYELVTLATEKFYYFPRIDYSIINSVTDNVFILSGQNPDFDRFDFTRKNFFVELAPNTSKSVAKFAHDNELSVVAVSDNYFPSPADRAAYEMIVSLGIERKTTPMHILSDYEWRLIWNSDAALENAAHIANLCTAELQKAEMVHPVHEKTLMQMCLDGAQERGLVLTEVYMQRLTREVDLIIEKKIDDYFYLVADMCQYARKHMLVGPARGSSCGSLVCYLLHITEIDPLPYNLLFERFIDVNRIDYPDIDIDFPDNKREMVFEYLRQTYGRERVAQLGTVALYRAKNTISDVAKNLGIPAWEVNDVKDGIIERSNGDARAKFCIMDTFEELDSGKKLLMKYPEIRIAERIEGHARHKAKHAAGMLVTANPVSWYCSIDEQTGTAQIDKYDAEVLNLLKIDALGLKTLSVIQDTLDQVGWSRQQLMDYPIGDNAAYMILNDRKFAGVFQFEGVSLQSLCNNMTVENFEDVAALTALARPGPLGSGGAAKYIKRRTGEHAVEYLHPSVKELTEVSYGVIVYQEQVMQIARNVGGLSWEDVSSLRKAMSKSLGKEFFDQFWERFKIGALENGVDEESAQNIWNSINTMGAWAFNRSHAVAYGLISYWCLVLKSKFPLEFGASCLRNAKSVDQTISVLRELKKEGYEYQSYDKNLSELNWSVQHGKLIGGLCGIKGIQERTAALILKKREAGEPLTKRQDELLSSGVTPWDTITECQDVWGHVLKEPRRYNIVSALTRLIDISDDEDGEYVFIAKIKEKNIKSHTDLHNTAKRGGDSISGPTTFLGLVVEDDTGLMNCGINRFDYERIGRKIAEGAKKGDWYLLKGRIKKGFRKIHIKKAKRMTGSADFLK